MSQHLSMRNLRNSFIVGSVALFVLLAGLVFLLPAEAIDVDSFGRMLALPFQTSTGISIFLVVTAFGSTVGIIAGMITLGIIYRHRPDIIARLVLALLGVTITGEYLKELLHRARPMTLSLLEPIHSYSFPSGHSSESMVLYGFLALLLYVHATSPMRKVLAIAIPALCILLIGFSRLVLSYHYLTDVLGGYMLGTAWIAISLSVPLYYAFYHQNPDHTEPITRPLI
jgi:membrane-associated phospholipid phosphatase